MLKTNRMHAYIKIHNGMVMGEEGKEWQNITILKCLSFQTDYEGVNIEPAFSTS